MDTENLYNSLQVAEAIKCISKKKHIVLKQMLLELGLGSNAMSHMRHGRPIASSSLARIADYLDCSVDYLLGRTDTPEIHKPASKGDCLMNETLEAWKGHLALVGETAFQASHPGDYDEDLVSALIHATAAMIAENDAAHIPEGG